MAWFHQRKGYELGNFIMVTPALRLLAAKWGKPVQVFFDTTYVSLLYQRCPFIEPLVLVQPVSEPINRGINLPPRVAGASDYQGWCHYFNLQGPIMPYVDVQELIPALTHRTAIMHGCMPGSVWAIKKDLGAVCRLHILRGVENPLILGSEADYEAFWKDLPLPAGTDVHISNDVVDLTKHLASCQSFVSNDTGLYHVAAALGKQGTVIWKGTDFTKNRAPNPMIRHILMTGRNEFQHIGGPSLEIKS